MTPAVGDEVQINKQTMSKLYNALTVNLSQPVSDFLSLIKEIIKTLLTRYTTTIVKMKKYLYRLNYFQGTTLDTYSDIHNRKKTHI